MTSSNSTKKPFDLTGLKFHRLLAIEKTDRRRNKHVVWKFLCDCGNEHFAPATDVKNGATKSCGCLRIERITILNTSHGAARNGVRTRAYCSWEAMIARCTRPQHKSFHRYGGRGISVCDRWSDFQSFLDDMGDPPNGRSLDRIENNGNYEPTNCRWATATEQCHNKNNNVILEIDGKSLPIAAWAKLANMHPVTIWHRLNRGLSHRDAVFAPLRRILKPKS